MGITRIRLERRFAAGLPPYEHETIDVKYVIDAEGGEDAFAAMATLREFVAVSATVTHERRKGIVSKAVERMGREAAEAVFGGWQTMTTVQFSRAVELSKGDGEVQKTREFVWRQMVAKKGQSAADLNTKGIGKLTDEEFDSLIERCKSLEDI